MSGDYKRLSFGMQDVAFYGLKGYLLHHKRSLLENSSIKRNVVCVK